MVVTLVLGLLSRLKQNQKMELKANLQHCKGKNGVKYSLREKWQCEGKVKQLGKVCGQMESPPSIHTTSHDELKVRFFLPFLLSSHFFNPFFSSLLLSSFNFFFSPLYFSFNFSSPLFFSSSFFSSSLYCKSLQRTAKGNHDSKCYDNKWAFPVGHKKKIRDGDQVLGHIDFWASTSRHSHPYSPFAMEPLRVSVSIENSDWTGRQVIWGLKKPDAASIIPTMCLKIIEENLGKRIFYNSGRWWIMKKCQQQQEQFQWWCGSAHKWRTLRISRLFLLWVNIISHVWVDVEVVVCKLFGNTLLLQYYSSSSTSSSNSC